MTSEHHKWGRCGLPSLETVEVRNTVSALICAYLSRKGLDLERNVAVGAGFKLLVLELHAPFSREQEIEMEQILARSIPSDHTFQIWRDMKQVNAAPPGAARYRSDAQELLCHHSLTAKEPEGESADLTRF